MADAWNAEGCTSYIFKIYKEKKLVELKKCFSLTDDN